LLVDGGVLDIGIESTVVDVTGDAPVILRPGAITEEMLTGLPQSPEGQSPEGPPRSPGIKYRHYAPKAPMTLLSGTSEAIASYITTHIISETDDAHIGVLVSPRVRAHMDKSWPMMALQSDTAFTPLVTVLTLGDPRDMPAIAKNLFANLRRFDEKGADIILAEALPPTGLGAAVMDRMTKAAEGRVIPLGERVP
jgi:L-threonylcarbamoyladenylate synthase